MDVITDGNDVRAAMLEDWNRHRASLPRELLDLLNRKDELNQQLRDAHTAGWVSGATFMGLEMSEVIARQVGDGSRNEP